MANYGFGITAAQVNKVRNAGDWTDELRLSCYMAAAIAELPDTTANAKFVFLLGSLGIAHAKHTKGNSVEQWIDTYAVNGKVENALTELDMQKAIAKIMFPQTPEVNSPWLMIAAVKGNDLTDLYNRLCSKGKDAKFVLHRIIIGQNTLYRICPDTELPETILADALRYIAKE